LRNGIKEIYTRDEPTANESGKGVRKKFEAHKCLEEREGKGGAKDKGGTFLKGMRREKKSKSRLQTQREPRTGET